MPVRLRQQIDRIYEHEQRSFKLRARKSKAFCSRFMVDIFTVPTSCFVCVYGSVHGVSELAREQDEKLWYVAIKTPLFRATLFLFFRVFYVRLVWA